MTAASEAVIILPSEPARSRQPWRKQDRRRKAVGQTLNQMIKGQCALLAVGISRAQAFVEGNKRTAFIATDVFLWPNGYACVGDPLEMARQLEAVANRQGSLEEATSSFAEWLRGQVTTL